jgi:4-amino-4-deoxy-L-arabinose transferase-like glycosyltransferase
MIQKYSRWFELGTFAIIVLFAAFLRLYRLDQLPPGLHYDEAFNATMAQRVLAGVERPIFFTEDLTEEPMAIYITSLSFALFGASPWSLRLVSAMAGILTVAALYVLARGLFRWRWVAALASFTLAILYWHVNFSRLGMEPIFLPLTLTVAMAFLWRALNRQKTRDYVLAGVFLAATQYTYKAALFVPIFVAAFIGLEILVRRDFWTRHARGLIFGAIVAVLFFAPLGLYLATHPEQFWERPGSVTATLTSETIVDHTIKVAGMFLVRGDDNPRSNLPGRPALDPVLAMGFIVGIVGSMAQIRKKTESRFLLLWLGVMSLPSVLTDFAPHFGRNIGATPAIALIIAFGFAFIIAQARHKVLLTTVYCLLITGLSFSTYSTYNDYFNVWGARTGLFDSFDVGQLTLAQKLRNRPSDEAIYLSPIDAHHYTIQFGLAGRAASQFRWAARVGHLAKASDVRHRYTRRSEIVDALANDFCARSNDRNDQRLDGQTVRRALSRGRHTARRAATNRPRASRR